MQNADAGLAIRMRRRALQDNHVQIRVEEENLLDRNVHQ